MATSIQRIRAPLRCFLCEINATVDHEYKIVQNSLSEKVRLRLLGTIVSIVSDIQTSTITIDDGTATATFQSSVFQSQYISAQPGVLIECIVGVHVVSDATKLPHSPVLVAEQLFSLANDEHRETLRWLELSQCRRQLFSEDDSSLGYPALQDDPPQPEDLLMVISGFALCSTASHANDKSDGVTLHDLAVSFGIEESETMRLIHKLQVRVYIFIMLL